MLVIVTALVAAAGLAGAGNGSAAAGGGTRGVDLLVPLLVLAAAGVVAGWVPGLLAGRSGTARPGKTVFWLARRRLGGAGSERKLSVLVVTAGLGMLLFALAALQSTAVSAEDRVAVAAGAEAVATLEGSWELDQAAPSVPAPDQYGRLPPGPVPGVRTPPLPADATMVWRADVSTPLDAVQRDMLLIDPGRFPEVALWGRGADLAAARSAVSRLGAGGGERTIPVIAVADAAVAGLDSVQATVGYETTNLKVIAHVPAFPGMQGRPMFVAAAAPVFERLGPADPRLRPRAGLIGTGLFSRTYLWSGAGAGGIAAVTTPEGVRPERVETAAELRQGDSYVAAGRARGYQVAVAGYLALLAMLTLCVFAQRTAAARRPADLMLARIGLGRARVLRARAVELVLLSVVSLGAALAGVAAIAPIGGRLLDDQPGLLPSFHFGLPPIAPAVTAGVAALATILAVLLSTASRGAEEDAYRDD